MRPSSINRLLSSTVTAYGMLLFVAVLLLGSVAAGAPDAPLVPPNDPPLTAPTRAPFPGSSPTPAPPTATPQPSPTRPAPTPTSSPATTPTPTATPDAVGPAGWDALAAELTAPADGQHGETVVSITDLQTGRTIQVNGSRAQLAACTITIPIVMLVAQDIEAGRYPAEEDEGLVRAAMGPSNTHVSRELLRYVGGGDIGGGIGRGTALTRSLGLADSFLDHPAGYSWEDDGYGDRDTVLTTDDLALLLSKLYRGEALSPGTTGYVLWSKTIAPDWMDQPLGAPLPESNRLHHKIGQLYAPRSTWNDAGIVVFERAGRGHAYAIASLGSGQSSWWVAYAHAQQVSRAAEAYFDAANRG